MIIIEEDEDEVVVNSQGGEGPQEEEELTPEERRYRSAVELMESVDCVERYERAVISLKAAADLFDKLGDYKDSVKKAQACREQAQLVEETGKEEAYQAALELYDNARTKMDYRTAISELKRFPDYKDSQIRIEDSKKAIVKLEKREVWKNRGIFVVILAALAVVLFLSPAKPYAKGYVHMKQGHYKLAVQNFREAGDFINSANMRKKCRYQMALAAQEKGNVQKAMRMCRLAFGNKEADALLARLEQESMQTLRAGDYVSFGQGEWLVLDRDEEQALLKLFYVGECKSVVYKGEMLSGTDSENDYWNASHVRKWMNKMYKKKIFNTDERRLLARTSFGAEVICHTSDADTAEGEKLYLLNSEEYEEYRALIQREPYSLEDSSEEQQIKQNEAAKQLSSQDWWLRDSRESGSVCFVSAVSGTYQTGGDMTQKMGVRPVVDVMLDAKITE